MSSQSWHFMRVSENYIIIIVLKSYNNLTSNINKGNITDDSSKVYHNNSMFSMFNKEVHKSNSDITQGIKDSKHIKIENDDRSYSKNNITKIDNQGTEKLFKSLDAIGEYLDNSAYEGISDHEKAKLVNRSFNIPTNINSNTIFNKVQIYNKTRTRSSKNNGFDQRSIANQSMNSKDSLQEPSFVIKKNLNDEKFDVSKLSQYKKFLPSVTNTLGRSNYDYNQMANEIMDSFFTFRGNLSRDIRSIKSTGASCLTISDFKDIKSLVFDILKYYQDYDKDIQKLANEAKIESYEK